MTLQETAPVDLSTPTGPMRTHLFRPAAPGRYPGILLYSEIFQVTAPIRRTAALAALRVTPFDLVLMDVEMPELDGPAATRALRAEFPAARQPVVIAVTAHALTASRDEFLAAGMDAILTKPIRLAELTALLARLPSLLPAP